jgi:predicted kinase
LLVIIGGPPGSGNTSRSRRLARDRGWPVLGSDDLARTIAGSAGLKDGDAYWIAYDVAFAMAEEWLSLGVSAVLDINPGWTFQWQQVDALRQHHPLAKIVPIVLPCSRQTCLERIDRRHMADPSVFDPPRRFRTDPRILAVSTVGKRSMRHGPCWLTPKERTMKSTRRSRALWPLTGQKKLECGADSCDPLKILVPSSRPGEAPTPAEHELVPPAQE